MESGRKLKRVADFDEACVQPLGVSSPSKRGRWTAAPQVPEACNFAATPLTATDPGLHLQHQAQAQAQAAAQYHAQQAAEQALAVQAQQAQQAAALQAQQRPLGAITQMHPSTSSPGPHAWSAHNDVHHSAGLILSHPQSGSSGGSLSGRSLKRTNSAPELWKLQMGLLQSQCDPGSAQNLQQQQAMQQQQQQAMQQEQQRQLFMQQQHALQQQRMLQQQQQQPPPHQ
mmetsp:Transcript_31673/g.56694  ORF Transcript_31673/g.56694 Transcript_31673/m.56694 type:complete len:228 (-) Transcript_31673:94-777(-)